MRIKSIGNLKREATLLRNQLESAFTQDTALGGLKNNIASAGQCAAVAVIVSTKFGGSLVSAMVEGNSHWFNRIRIGAKSVDLDITGDQFGRPNIQIGPEGTLYHGERLRQPDELKKETIARAALLANQAGLMEIGKSSIDIWSNYPNSGTTGPNESKSLLNAIPQQ